MKLGDQSTVLVRNKLTGAPHLTSRQLYLALAARVPDPANPAAQIRNPYTSWNQIDPALGYDVIQFIGPDPKSPLGQAVLASLMAPGCATSNVAAAALASDADRFAEVCGEVRTDAAYLIVPVTSGSSAVVERLSISPASIGIIGAHESLLTQSIPWLLVGKIDGIVPTPETIAAANYPATNALYLYVNRSNLLRSNVLFDQSMTLLATLAVRSIEGGFLTGLPADERATVRAAARAQLLR
jgi:phosphate transport system substrate-binding protein